MQHVIVIGGGVVGLTSAWWLLEAGYAVTLLEREGAVGTAASYRNGGQLSYRYVSPLADAGVPLKALQWLMQADGPLRFRPEADLRQWRWLASFLANCTAGANAKTTARLLKLGELQPQENGRARSRAAARRIRLARRRQAGGLPLARHASTPRSARPDSEASRQVLSPAECVAREPALADAEGMLAGGIFNSGEAVADCARILPRA